MYQKLVLLGNIGKEPVRKTTATGKENLSFSVATKKNQKNAAGDYEDKTTWHNVTVWGKSVDYLSKRLNKGSKVFVEGELNVNKYVKDGIEKTFTNVFAHSVQCLDKQTKEQQDNANLMQSNTQVKQSAEIDLSSLPF
jgi:single-strand DNA-binding protein